MKNWMKKSISVILTLMLLLSNIPVVSFAASTEHSHPICGNSCACASDSHEDNNWEPWDGTTKMYGGYYYLTQDVVLDSTMILDYSYTTYLCLNGHRIFCEDTVFNIYSYRSLVIADCVGTGAVESADTWCTISNSNNLAIWGGSILNTQENNGMPMAIEVFADTNTCVYGGSVSCANGPAIFTLPGSNIEVHGGTVHGGNGNAAIYNNGDGSGRVGSILISGGRITSTQRDLVIAVPDGDFTMTGGYVGGSIDISGGGSTIIRGGTIDGELYSYNDKNTITGGNVTGSYYGLFLTGEATISAGSFAGSYSRTGANTTITGGDFTDSAVLLVTGETWISGGSYAKIRVEDAPLYLSGVPEIESLQVGYPATVSAQSPDGTGSFGGGTIEVILGYPEDSAAWEDGDIVIQNVKSDTVAEKFVLGGEEASWMGLERSGNNLVLQDLPHGTCGDNLTWSLKDGTLTISGTGDMYDYDYEASGNETAPWYDIRDQISSVVVEDGVTSVGNYAFYFNNSLNSVVLPGSVGRVGDWAMAWNDNLESVTFKGAAPAMSEDIFMDTGSRVTNGTTCYYPAGDSSWSGVINNYYGSPINWVPVEDSSVPEDYDWTLTADKLYVAVGETVRLEALGNDGEPVKGDFCEWYLSDTSLAQLSGNGYWATLYAREPGTVKVTLATALGDKSVDIVIEQNLGTPDDPAVALGDNNLIGAWSTVQATFTPPYGSDEYVFFVEGDNANWSIRFDHGAEAVYHRTYFAHGYRVQLQEGVTYNVQIQNNSGEDLRLRMMSISPDAPDLAFPSDTQAHAYVGDNWSFPVLPIPPDGKLQGSIRWSETDNTVVSLTAVDDRVELVFIGEGTVTITAEDTGSGKTASHTITVYGDQGSDHNGSTIEFQGNGGTFEVTTAQESWPTDGYGYEVPAGESMGDYVVNISDPVFWNSDRAFTKWMACTHEVIYNDEGMQIGEDNVQIPGSQLMTTAEALQYPARADGKTVIMVAQWEGSEFDYYSDVGFEVYGGTLIVDPQGDEAPFETPAPGGRCREDGSTIGQQLWFTIPNPPTHAEYDFEGWLQYNEETGELISEDTLTFAEIQNLVVPHYNVRFVAKWSGISMEQYRNFYTHGGDDGEESFNVGVTGGQYGRFITTKNGEEWSGLSGSVCMHVPAGSSLAREGFQFVDWEFYPEYQGQTHTRIGWYVGTWVDDNGNFEKLPGSGLLSDEEMLNYTISADQEIVFEAQWDEESTDDGDVTVDGYVASITADAEVFNGDRILALIKANHSEETQFAAGEVVVSYDSSMMTFNREASNLGNATVKDNDGILVLEDYGEDKLFSNTAYVLAFDTKTTGTVTLTLESAAFVNKENAVKSDLIPATLEPATAVVTISRSRYPVALDGFFTGPATATDGESYTFYAADTKHYVYESVSAVMGGNSAPVTDNGDGSYTVANVNGPLTITGSCSARSFQVTFDGSGAADITGARPAATYGTGYVFDLPSKDGATYTLEQILIDGQVYTDYIVTGNTVTIDGMHIHGDMVITIAKTVAEATIKVEGNGAGAAAGYVTEVELGALYVLSLNPAAGYTYTVTATMNGEPVDVIDNGDNTYTIEKVTGDVVFTVTRSLVTDAVTVSQYLKINGANVWIVKFSAEVEPGKVPAYDGNPMFWSEEYDAYCYLVITEVLDEAEAKSKLDITDGTAPVVGDSMDVNGSGKVDASDAQLVYNMYNAMYDGFDGDVTVEKYLRADVNRDGEINVQDAAAIIAHILA